MPAVPHLTLDLLAYKLLSLGNPTCKQSQPKMAVEKVVPTAKELEQFDLSDAHTVELINRAQEGDAADRKLTVRQALVKYKKAVFWALFLSTSLIMEGYDLVIVGPPKVFALVVSHSADI